jgi:hypothetical protein
MPCILRDTAGFRISDSSSSHDFDIIELEGMKRARFEPLKAIRLISADIRDVYHSSHLVVFVIDLSDIQRNIQVRLRLRLLLHSLFLPWSSCLS